MQRVMLIAQEGSRFTDWGLKYSALQETCNDDVRPCACVDSVGIELFLTIVFEVIFGRAS